MAHAGSPVALKDKIIPSEMSGRTGAVKILREALVVLGAGIAVALAANQISPLGLALTRNYFPGDASRPAVVTPTHVSPGTVSTNPPALSPAQLLAARMKAQGLQLAESNQVEQWFHDPRYQQDRIVFIDARDEQHFREGHIPGAREFDPYRPERNFADVLPACQQAEQVVVYCNGGDCDDSESAAILLRDSGTANQKLFVYGGGITEWTARGLPVETGERNSGTLRKTSP